jgi:hypothetical protein
MNSSKLATFIAVFVGLAMSSTAYAEKSDGKKTDIKHASGIEFETTLGFKDVDSSSDVFDWGVDSKGPEIGFEAFSGFDFGVPGISWLRTGPTFLSSGELDLETMTTVGGAPYLVGESYRLMGLLGWDAKGRWNIDGTTLKADFTALGGVDVLDLTDADADYLPSGADAGDFWFRVLPCLGFGLDGSYTFSILDVTFANRYLATWDSGTAYGRSWSAGFDEKLDLSISARVVDAEAFDLSLKASAGYSLVSGLIDPIQKINARLRTDLMWKDAGKLKLTFFQWTEKASLPDLNFAAAEDVERQLSSSIAWETRAASLAGWTIGLSVPWYAWVDGAACPGAWQISFSRSIEDK